MAVNLITTYKRQMVEGFYHDSYTLNKTSQNYSFDGSQSIVLKSYVTIDPTEDWTADGRRAPRVGGNRFGTPTDVEDVIQTLKLRHHTCWTKSIDGSDNAQSAYMYRAAQFMAIQNREKDMPLRDKYNLREWALHAGTTYTLGAALSKSNVIEALLDHEVKLDDAGVPKDNRWTYVPLAYRKYIRLASEWVGADSITREKILKGYDGDLGTLKIVFVPSGYMPANVEFLTTYQGSVIAPLIWKTARILTDVQGYDGPVLEYHTLDDAFVIGKKDKGVVAAIKYGSSAQATTPTFGTVAGSGSGTYIPVTSSGNTIWATIDGTDPLWSDTAVSGASALNVVIGTGYTGVIRAVARKETAGSEKYTSLEGTQSMANSAKV